MKIRTFLLAVFVTASLSPAPLVLAQMPDIEAPSETEDRPILVKVVGEITVRNGRAVSSTTVPNIGLHEEDAGVQARAYVQAVASRRYARSLNRKAAGLVARAEKRAKDWSRRYTDAVAFRTYQAAKRYVQTQAQAEAFNAAATAEGNAKVYTDVSVNAAEKRIVSRVQAAHQRISNLQKRGDLGGWAILVALLAVLLSVFALLRATGTGIRIPHPHYGP